MGYWKGSKSYKFNGGKVRRFPDGRIMIEMDVFTDFSASPSSKKPLSDLFRDITGISAKILVVPDSYKERGKKQYITNVSIYAVVKDMPPISVFEELAEKARCVMVPYRFFRRTKEGVTEVPADSVSYMMSSLIINECKRKGYHGGELVRWTVK